MAIAAECPQCHSKQSVSQLGDFLEMLDKTLDTRQNTNKKEVNQNQLTP